MIRLGLALGVICCFGETGLSSPLGGSTRGKAQVGTTASLIYRKTKNLRAIELLLGHTKLGSTVRYPDIEVDDALEAAEQTEV